MKNFLAALQQKILNIFLNVDNFWQCQLPFATMRQMIETEADLDEKEWFVSLKFGISSENFDSGYGHDSNRNSISMWHYNQQDRFVMKISWYKEKIL